MEPAGSVNNSRLRSVSVWVGILATAVIYLYAQNAHPMQGGCTYEKWDARIRNIGKESVIPTSVFISENILPKRLNFHSEDLQPSESYLTILAPLGSKTAAFSTPYGKYARQTIYWFGSGGYAHCKFEGMVAWDNLYVPAIWWAEKRGDTDPLRGFYGIDAINCFGGTFAQPADSCIWVELQGEYVITFVGSVGVDALSLDEFDGIIASIDRQARQFLGAQ